MSGVVVTDVVPGVVVTDIVPGDVAPEVLSGVVFRCVSSQLHFVEDLGVLCFRREQCTKNASLRQRS